MTTLNYYIILFLGILLVSTGVDAAADQTLPDKLKGRILLQVEANGEAWYVNPADSKRYYMKDGPTAYEMMRQFGLGITNANLDKLPQEGETKTFPTALNHVKGKILLQVENHGEAWYVNTKTGYRYYMRDGEAAYNLMRYYSLGITNSDLAKITEGVVQILDTNSVAGTQIATPESNQPELTEWEKSILEKQEKERLKEQRGLAEIQRLQEEVTQQRNPLLNEISKIKSQQKKQSTEAGMVVYGSPTFTEIIVSYYKGGTLIKPDSRFEEVAFLQNSVDTITFDIRATDPRSLPLQFRAVLSLDLRNISLRNKTADVWSDNRIISVDIPQDYVGGVLIQIQAKNNGDYFSYDIDSGSGPVIHSHFDTIEFFPICLIK